jgi:hypothetical protein
MELVVVELDTDVELNSIECAEVASAELVSGTNFDSSCGRWIERSHSGRREFVRGARGSGRERTTHSDASDANEWMRRVRTKSHAMTRATRASERG